ncbi:MAG: hypothetical protein IPM55_10830 [Acidobacteria bacterium]|nr:hypothetical protein [Acidobacteriota bacterium]
MRSTISRFKGVEHRLEYVDEIDGIRFYNDSKATNVDAAIKSLEAFPGGIIVIFGGKDKGGDFTPLAPLVRERCREVILRSAPRRQDPRRSRKYAPAPSRRVDGRGRRAWVKPGLSGRCCAARTGMQASFDMFTSYEHRGRVFKEAVNKVKVKSRK